MQRNNLLKYSIVGMVTLLVALTFSFSSPRFIEDSNPADSLYIGGKIHYDRYYPFIKYKNNFVEWTNVQAVSHFYEALKNSNHKKVRVLHIGDSHVQADIFTGYIREHMQDIFGAGGRGFIFPYAAAGTHSAYDYRSYYTGAWNGIRNIQNNELHDMGLTGATVWTSDPNATLRFTFQYETLRPSFRKVKIWCKKGIQSFDMKIKYNLLDDEIFVKTNSDSSCSYVSCIIPAASENFEISMFASDSLQTGFECYGVEFETEENKGVEYSSVGINGAGFNHLLHENLFEQQLRDYQPDLVIVDMGANDYYLGGLNWNDFENNLVRIVDNIKEACPETSIILSCSQDIYRRGMNVIGTQNHAQIIKKVAGDRNCAYYNYFKVAGGQYSMYQWRKYGLANRDFVHLSAAGYYVKGSLIVNGILNSYLRYLGSNNTNIDTEKDMISNLPDSIFSLKDSILVETYSIENDTTKLKLYYKVKSGESVSSIAKKYNVTVFDIKDWNDLSSNYLKIGQLLVLYVNKPKPAPLNKKAATTKTAPGIIKYKVKYGDTMWGIATKYGVTMTQIRTWNNMKNNNIAPGKILIIKK